LTPETRNLHRLLVSGINGKNSAMGYLSDHKSSSAGSIPVSPNRHGINQRKIIPLKEFPETTSKLMLMTGNKKYSPVGTKSPAPCGARFMIREKSHCTIFTIDSRNQ
jgi:hypothetical protein